MQKKEEKKNVSIERLDESVLSIEHQILLEHELKLLEGCSTIHLEDDNGNSIAIGHISFHIYNLNSMNMNKLLDNADAISSDEHILISTYLKCLDATNEFDFENSFEMIEGMQLVTIDVIQVDELYRNKGYGSDAIKEFLKFLKLLSQDIVILQPAPIEDAEYNREERIERLINFYSQFGFELFDKGVEHPIMHVEI